MVFKNDCSDENTRKVSFPTEPLPNLVAQSFPHRANWEAAVDAVLSAPDEIDTAICCGLHTGFLHFLLSHKNRRVAEQGTGFRKYEKSTLGEYSVGMYFFVVDRNDDLLMAPRINKIIVGTANSKNNDRSDRLISVVLEE